MKEHYTLPQDRPIGPSLIIELSCRIMIPFIQLFALYVIAHGHYSPGGGFQGGVLLGAAYILMAIAFDQKTSMRFFPLRVNTALAGTGVLIYTGTGIACALLGGLFLDYSALAPLIPLGPVEWRSMGIFIVEVGVGLAVMSIMVSLFWDLASGGKLDRGL
ncbi:MAG TPA: Na(+)/H(+) antiporter subunit B [Syntrophales bacterium]|nr:Na(+)/H(+) antiporter subunit B [Syntrophobacterales bacterium]HQL90800.1 Na(+)/H(+) antiporter subunit B [Syntrophales bacterium]